MFFKELLRILLPASAVPHDERREAVRLSCRLKAVLSAGDRLFTAVLVNLATDGFCLELDSELTTGESIVLTRDDFGPPMEGRVIWCKPNTGGEGYLLGMEYEADEERLRASWIRPALEQSGFKAEVPDEKRLLVRIPGRVKCNLKGLTGETYTEGEMLDLSLGGALVESPLQLNEGLTIEFETFPKGGLPPLKGVAKIASSRKAQESELWRCGLKFTESSDRDVALCMEGMLASK